MKCLFVLVGLLSATCFALAAQTEAPERGAVRFNTAFESAAIGQIEVVGATEFRVHVPGQQDERGRNRQATWFYFRMDNVRDRDLTITLTGFLPGEYNDKPSPHMSGEPMPVFSYDNEHWEHFSSMAWDNEKKEGVLRVRAKADSLWLALVPPYPYSRLVRLLGEIAALPHARVEIVGRSVLGRELPVVTVTDFSKPDAGKKTVWLQARDHAWESPTSFIMEGAIKFIVSDEPQARALRETHVFMFTPMVDPDGCALGQVRFNANGWDLNRHWDDIDLRDPVWLQRLPEIWYYKKAIRDYVATSGKVALMINLHNTISEYMSARAPKEADVPLLQRLYDILVEKTQFEPARPIQVRPWTGRGADSAQPWWVTYDVPMALIETRIAPGRKLKGSPTAEQRTAFGKELLLAMVESVQ
jgi:hypothetical protein